jgi:hypothetical protein
MNRMLRGALAPLIWALVGCDAASTAPADAGSPAPVADDSSVAQLSDATVAPPTDAEQALAAALTPPSDAFVRDFQNATAAGGVEVGGRFLELALDLGAQNVVYGQGGTTGYGILPVNIPCQGPDRLAPDPGQSLGLSDTLPAFDYGDVDTVWVELGDGGKSLFDVCYAVRDSTWHVNQASVRSTYDPVTKRRIAVLPVHAQSITAFALTSSTTSTILRVAFTASSHGAAHDAGNGPVSLLDAGWLDAGELDGGAATDAGDLPHAADGGVLCQFRPGTWTNGHDCPGDSVCANGWACLGMPDGGIGHCAIGLGAGSPCARDCPCIGAPGCDVGNGCASGHCARGLCL